MQLLKAQLVFPRIMYMWEVASTNSCGSSGLKKTPFGLGSRVIRGPFICLVSRRAVESCIWHFQSAASERVTILDVFYWYSTKLSIKVVMFLNHGTRHSILELFVPPLHACQSLWRRQCWPMMQAGSTTQSECACCVRSFLLALADQPQRKFMLYEHWSFMSFFNVMCFWIWWLRSYSIFLLQVPNGLVNVCIHWMLHNTKESTHIFSITLL